MGLTTRNAAVLLITAVALGGCVTKGTFRRAIADQQAALAAEKTDRQAADDKATQDLSSLRTDLTAMRTDFGAKISAVEDGLKFAVPVHFGFDSADLRPEDSAVLDRFANIATKYYPGATVTVEGFADPAGTLAYNRRLSLRRAEAVKQYLEQKQLTTIRTVGYGKTRLIVPGAYKDKPGAELNRRVVFVIESPAAAAAVANLDH